MEFVNLEQIKRFAEKGKGGIDRIYLHWTAGRYDQIFADYHINIVGDGNICISTRDFTIKKAHTWRRNSRAIGICLCCAYHATTNNMGDYPPTTKQIESMSKVVATLSEALNLPISAETVMTHAEAADLDDYGPSTTCERWDLWFLSDSADGQIKNGGDVIREKAIWYQQQGAVKMMWVLTLTYRIFASLFIAAVIFSVING